MVADEKKPKLDILFSNTKSTTLFGIDLMKALKDDEEENFGQSKLTLPQFIQVDVGNGDDQPHVSKLEKLQSQMDKALQTANDELEPNLISLEDIIQKKAVEYDGIQNIESYIRKSD